MHNKAIMTSLVNDDFKDNKVQNNTDDLATELRNTINSSLINVGVLAVTPHWCRGVDHGISGSYF